MLTQRLRSVLNEIPQGNWSVADIGADHSKLIVTAVLENRCSIGYAVDISYPSLIKGKNYAERKRVSQQIEFLHGNGFLPINNEIDYAVICGMGGNEITSILSQKDIAKTYILSPHQDAHVLRKYLNENGFTAVKDYVVYDKKFYPIIVAVKGNGVYSEKEIFLGKNLPKTDDYEVKNQRRLDYLEKQIGINLENKSQYKNELREEYEVLKEWQRSVT